MKFKDDNLLNDIDLHIIDILAKDSSTPFVEIAKQMGLSDATVYIRIKRLIEERIIKKFTLSINNDLFVKVRAKDLNHMRDIIENKIGIRPNILKIKLMIILN